MRGSRQTEVVHEVVWGFRIFPGEGVTPAVFAGTEPPS